jgi:CO/xanthine dehydrogenase Mo-binding subunit/aerobic-type carbon monoxide dehydrogenase small subunit (CoxS/CutS family)
MYIPFQHEHYEKMKMIKTKFYINDQFIEATVDPDMNLMNYLRDTFGLVGTKNGCSTGHCGACTVIINKVARRACLVKMAKIDNAWIETIEGLSKHGELHPLQQAFMSTGASQCGFCTPGMIMTAKALLDSNPRPSKEEIKIALTQNRNLCRCTGYVSIIEAIQIAAEEINNGVDTSLLHISQPLFRNPQLRKDAEKKVTGKIEFGADMMMDQMLFGKILWAEHPHARIVSIDTSQAESIEGVTLVITAKDIPGKNQAGIIIRDQPAIAEEKVRYIGDSVACVFAETEELAERAREKIKVEYTVLPAVFTPEEAALPGAPKVHEKGNLLRHASIVRGDVENAFSECAVVVEDYYSTPFIEHGFLEPESGIAFVDDNNDLIIKMGSQTVFDDRTQLSEILNLPEERIRIIQIPQGGSFGAKEDLIFQQHLAIGALRTRRPVKIVLTREESLRVHEKRHPVQMRYKTGADKEGHILAVEAEFTLDTGAYASLGVDVLENVVVFGAGPYYVPNIKINGNAWYTNNVLCGAMRGFGVNQLAIGLEQQIDAMARALKIDPFSFRIINAWRVGLPTAADHVLELGVDGIKETIEAAQKSCLEYDLTGFHHRENTRIGMGVASAVKNVGFGHGIPESAGAIVELDSSGKITLKVSHHEYGQGGHAGEIKIACDELGVPLSQLELIGPDTATTPRTGPTTASRQSFLTGNAVVLACRELKNQVFAHAAEIMDIEPSRLSLMGNKIIHQESGRFIEISELGEHFAVERRYSSLKTDQILENEASHFGKPDFQSRITHVMYSYTTQVAVVEVNIQSGEVRVLKIISANDLGKVLNPQIVKGQIEGGVMMGIGFALSEQFKVERGVNLTDTLHKTRMPLAEKTPEIVPIMVEVPHPYSPQGMKGFAEAPSLATAPAILNAIYDAIGVRINDIPADKGKVKEAIREFEQ